MKSIHNLREILNKSRNFLLLVASLSILMLLANFNGIAQANYQNYYYPKIPTLSVAQNFTQYNWQNYNFTSYPNYNYNQFMQPSLFKQILPNYGPNYSNFGYGVPSAYNYGVMNYNYGMTNYNYGMTNYNTYTNYGNSAYLNPSGSYSSLVPSWTNYYQGPSAFYPSSVPTIPGYNFYSPLNPNPYSPPKPNYTPEIILPRPREVEYLAVLPKALHIGAEETVSISLFNDEVPSRQRAMGKIGVTLLRGSEKIIEVENVITNKGVIKFMVPEVEVGEYELKIKGADFENKTNVSVMEDLLVFLQTDKPIYQPGQTIHMRVITLTSELRPKISFVVVEVKDAKGIKIFRKEVITDEYGMATLDLPVSREPNLGVWKINTISEQASSQLDIRVEKYVLPKFEVKPELPKEWFLVDEAIVGKVKAEYSFGKPVKGELVIEASRYVGEWTVYETFSKEIDGETEFEISPVGYVAGVPEAGGKGNITLDIIVKERNTDYEEKTNRLITVSDTPLVLQVIPEGSVFKPLLPFNLLIVAKTPDHKPRHVNANIKVTYIDTELTDMGTTEEVLETTGGKALLTITPPEGCAALTVDVDAEGVNVTKAVESGYSPSGNFIHLEQISQGTPKVGEEIWFKVHSTNEAVHFYFEVVSRDRVVFSDFTGSSQISVPVTPMMAPRAKLLVYQILPNSEVAADYLPFDVDAHYPHEINAHFSEDEVKPGEEVSITIETQGKAKVGLTAVDKSVFILAENRLNLQQVFDEIERLYMEPQAELHASSVYSKICTKGAKEIFKDAGVIVLTNKKIPQGKEYKKYVPSWGGWVPLWGGFGGFGGGFGGGFAAFGGGFGGAALGGIGGFGIGPVPGVPGINEAENLSLLDTEDLAQVEKIRQFFPETWLWQDLITDDEGLATMSAEAPDTITTWKLHAVGLSPEKGLGICEDEIKVFQPFFIKIDLPYSAIRGEEFPVGVSVYNYLDEKQTVLVEITDTGWFDLLDYSSKVVEVEANDIGGTQFKIRPTDLGIKEIEITARSSHAADAVIKTIIIIPEGIEKDLVENFVLPSGESRIFDSSLPGGIVEGSGRVYIAATSSYLSQTFEGLEELLKMPFGCGEQNMINFAPDVYIVRYLEETGQIKPEIMAKAEKMMITGYQRELTYRRSDGSFSAFGDRDEEGSLWLTAFVLKVFSQAKGLMFIDDDVLKEATDWIISHQNADGSFESVGFVIHKEMIGGLEGKTALTAYTAIALLEAGEPSSSAKAVGYLESRLDDITDAYTMAMVAYALELADSTEKDEACNNLMGFAQEDEDGLYWPANGAKIEATAYATLALMKHGDILNAGLAATWLVSKRNPFGGFNSTQDTVIALEALTAYSKFMSNDMDLLVEIKTGEATAKEINIGKENFDVLQIVEVPINEEIEIMASGKGKVVIQCVKRYNMPNPQQHGQTFNITVDYDTTEVEVNDLVTVSVDLEFTPLTLIEAGMVVLDISIPTGFTAVTETLEEIIEEREKIKRYDIAGRKVIFFIENMLPYEKLSFNFKVKALYPVKAKGTASQAYSYYNPKMKGETLGKEMTVLGQ
jgi:CD109 antigen